MAREVWIGIELVKNAEGMFEPTIRGVFSKKVRALNSGNRKDKKYIHALPVRINQRLPESYLMEYLEQ